MDANKAASDLSFAGLSDEEISSVLGEPSSTSQAPDDSFSGLNDEEIASVLGVDPDAPINELGLTPTEPIPGESALEISDRLALALGNEAGGKDYLTKKFGSDNVFQDKDGFTSVKGKDGKWRAVDPDTMDAPDSWSWTERLKRTAAEGVAEVAEGLPTAARVASGFAKIAGVSNFGVSTFAGAATEVALTSFGRALGTYKGGNVEQLKDVAFEGLLNTLGWGIEAGVKPTMAALAKTGAAKKIGQALSELPEDKIPAIADYFKFTTSGKITDDGVRILRDAPKELDQYIKQNAGLSYEAFQSKARLSAADEVAQAAVPVKAGIRQVAERMYGSVADDVVEGSFKASNADLIDPILAQFNSQGLVTIAGKTAQESADILAKQQGKLAAGQSWSVLSQADLKKLAATNPDIPDVLKQAAVDKEVYSQLRKPFETLSAYRNFASKTGSKEQVKQLIKLRKDISNITLDAKSAASATSLDRFFAGADETINRITKSVLPESAIKKLDEADAAYKELKNITAGLAELGNRGNMNNADTLINAMFSKTAAGTRKRSSIDSAVNIMEKYGNTATADTLRNLEKSILLKKAALEFTAPMASIVKQTALASAGTAAALTMNLDPLGATTALGTTGLVLASASPKVGYNIIKKQLEANALLRAGAKQVKSAAERAMLVDGALAGPLTVGFRMLQDKEDVKQNLLQQVPQP